MAFREHSLLLTQMQVSIFQIMLYAYRAVMVVGVGILYKVAIFPFCTLYYWQSMYAFDSYPQGLGQSSQSL